MYVTQKTRLLAKAERQDKERDKRQSTPAARVAVGGEGKYRRRKQNRKALTDGTF
jgi:hypothetical protein